MNLEQHNYNLELTTITPVSIGNGDTLSPYADYVYDERSKQAHLLRKEFIDNAVETKGLGDQYINAIYASFDNNRSNFDLNSFLENNLQLTSRDYAKQSIPCHGMQRNYRREVKAMLKNNEQPYIAGSTIKGAIKTALLYDWLSSESGKKEFDILMKDVLSGFKKCQREIGDIERISRRRNVSFSDKKEISRIQRTIRDKTKDLTRKIDKKFNELLNSEDKQFGRDFRHIRVGDTSLLDSSDRIFQLSHRLHYRKGTVDIPVNLEAIPKGKTTSLRLTIIPELKNENIQFLNKENKIKDLFDCINKFSEYNLDMEMELLDIHDWRDNARKREYEVFDAYGDFVEKQYNKIKNCSPNEAYLCLGFGKSFFYNSIGMLVNDWDADKELGKDELTVFKKYARLFFLGRPGQREFPMTRTITNGGMPMGWVRIKY